MARKQDADLPSVVPTPDRLARDFGTAGPVADQVIPSFYEVLSRALQDRQERSAADSFEKWHITFGEVAGSEKTLSTAGARRALHRFAANVGLPAEEVDVPRLLFVVHTYYALLIKLIVARLLMHDTGSPAGDKMRGQDATGPQLGHWMGRLESGEAFATLGLKGVVADDLFAWYLPWCSGEIAAALRLVLDLLHNYDLDGLTAQSRQTTDLLKPLYHGLLPREVRHALGEYYTPDWLAEHVLNEAGYAGDVQQRLLDPTCGSGTFLVLAIKRLRAECDRVGMGATETLQAVLRNVVGIDLNPLATLAARANYLLAVKDLLAHRRGSIDVPVHQADTILQSGAGEEELWGHENASLRTIGRFDVIAGNPPWIGWESLPPGYRQLTRPIWEHYGLFPHRGMAAILGQGKKDLSMLVSCVVTDKLLRNGGRLGFVITQSVFKNSGAAMGFRRFQFGTGPDDCVRVERVDDLSALQPFEGTGNRTCVFAWTKGQRTVYPVKYRVWQRPRNSRPTQQQDTLADVLSATQQLTLAAEPIDPDDPASAWLTVPATERSRFRQVIGRSEYQAHEGVNTGGANGIYWLEILQRRPDGTVVVRNITKGAKRRVPTVESALIEEDLIYPLLRGREVRRWRAVPSAHILLAQDSARRRGIDERRLRQKLPKTYSYLRQFADTLRSRAAFRRYFTRSQEGQTQEEAPFYSMFNVGPYTLCSHKVVWHRMVAPIGAAVVSEQDGRPVLPQETHAFVACTSAAEAYFLAGLLNSEVLNAVAAAYAQAGGKSFGSPQLISHLRLPRFVPEKESHRQISRLAQQIQEEIEELEEPELRRRHTLLDQAVASLFSPSKSNILAD